MKILKICGKNLASLAGEFEVDFQREPLASSGLFAISGPTGAGKSTLLDALCLALYDATPRLSRAGSKGIALPDVRDEVVTPQDTRTLLRRGTAEGYAEVDFVGNDGNSYRARWSVRRSRSKAEGALQNISMSLKQLPDLQPVGGTNREVKSEIERRIGLSFEQFTRAVLLAQNEFSAFLRADDSERGELLETLTGTAIYTDISRRAYERAKHEQQALQQLNLRLADQKPLDQEARLQLASELAQADQSAATLELRKSLLDAHLRWHQAWEQICEHERRADIDLERMTAERQAAAPRRAELARVEAVQSARQPLHECDRIAAEIADSRQALADGETGLAKAGTTLHEADAALAAAGRALLDAEQAQTAALPQLDRAKGLDAQIEALMPAHLKAGQALEQLRRSADEAQQALQRNEEERQQLLGRQQETLDWLARKAQLQALADGWPRWDTLFTQAHRCAQEHARLQTEFAAAYQNEAQKKSLADDAGLKLAGAQAAVSAAETLRATCLEKLAAFDLAALHERKQSADARRDLLTAAERLWRDYTGNASLQRELSDRTEQLRQAITGADAELVRIDAQLPAANAALAQAERALRIAEAACGESVEMLRAALEEDQPCPVCGSHEHPYRSEDPKWRAMLDSLHAEVGHCRDALQQLLRRQVTQTTLAAESRKQYEALAQQLQALEAAIRTSQQAWEAHPVAAELAAIEANERNAWFAGQQQSMRERVQAIVKEEQAAQQAARQRDKAQQEYETVTRQQALLKDAAMTATSALELASSQRAALAEKSADAEARLEATLAELDPVFRDPQWREAWQASREQFHSRCKADAAQWHAQCAARDEHLVRSGKLEVARHGLAEASAKANGDLARAGEAYASSAAALEERKAARKALFDGRPVDEIQATLRQALEAAKSAVAARAETRQQCANAEIRCREALDQVKHRLAAQTLAAEAATARLAAWIAEFNTATDTPLDITELRALLAHPPEWIAAERKQLQELDSAQQNAQAVLRERQAQRRTCEEQRPTADTPEAVQEALDHLRAERENAIAQATALRLSLAADEARRTKSAAMIADIERQEAITRQWAQLNELIGSADGKKFRNYAQQFTLDVLLGYANRHLAELARRYRLERIKDTLALMVVDQDMGEEMRSVHSLSGGESFLVSLALALGLASLSSNRVRVESLFIDEGFGSLDAETLSVAMDALDGLQAMGRKVGVISHVQEMTERIATKILVQRVTGGRSVVEVGGA